MSADVAASINVTNQHMHLIRRQALLEFVDMERFQLQEKTDGFKNTKPATVSEDYLHHTKWTEEW